MIYIEGLSPAILHTQFSTLGGRSFCHNCLSVAVKNSLNPVKGDDVTS